MTIFLVLLGLLIAATCVMAVRSWWAARTGTLRFGSVWGVRTSATMQDEHAWRAGQAAAAWIVLVQAAVLVGIYAFFVATVRGGSTGPWSAVFITLMVANVATTFVRRPVADRGVHRAPAPSLQHT